MFTALFLRIPRKGQVHLRGVNPPNGFGGSLQKAESQAGLESWELPGVAQVWLGQWDVTPLPHLGSRSLFYAKHFLFFLDYDVLVPG